MKILLSILIILLASVNNSCFNSIANSVEDKLSIDAVHPTPEDKQLFFKYKHLFEEQMYDSNSCYIIRRSLLACPNDTSRLCRQILEHKVANIFMNDAKDSIAVLVAYRHAWILDDDALEDEITQCTLMKAVVKEGGKLEFVCLPNNIWIDADGNQVESLLKKFKSLMINGGGYYIDGKVNENFIYQLFNEADAVLGNI